MCSRNPSALSSQEPERALLQDARHRRYAASLVTRHWASRRGTLPMLGQARANLPARYDDGETLATDFPEASKALIRSTLAPLSSEPRKKPSTTGSVICE